MVLRKSLLKFLILMVVLAALALLVNILDLDVKVESTRAFVDSFGMLAPLVFIAVYALATVVFLPGTPLTIAGGIVFGTFLGGVYTVIGASIGATIAFVAARYFGRGYVTRLLKRDSFKKILAYDKKIENGGFGVVLFLRLVPLFPFNGLNFALGLTRVTFRHYVWGTVLGIIPGSFALAYFGESLAMLSPVNIAISIILILLLVAVVPVYRRVTAELAEREFDVIVIGAGSGGLNVASFMNKAGFKVLLVDKKEENIGGDCLNYGCVPSKALIHAARTVRKAREAEDFGISSAGTVDMESIVKYIRSKQDVIRGHENAEYFRERGMRVELGEARFVSKNSVEVDGKTYSARRIVLATGSRPRTLELSGIETAAKVYNNENIFDIDFLPERIVFIGGGPIGIELAEAFRHLGSKVAVVNRDEGILGKEDPEISKRLLARLREQGIEFYLGYEPKYVVKGECLAVESADGKEEKLSFDALFVGVGRVLNIDNLDLEKAGIRKDEKGRKLIVDKYLRTTNKRVTACGDVAGAHQFTHAAELHAGVILKNFFTPFFKKKLDTSHIAWVTYTSSEVATFGLRKSELEDRGIEYEVLRAEFADDDRAIIDEYRYGLLKLFVSPKGEILGGSMVAPHAGELIQELILANTYGLTLSEIFEKVYPYPTAARINRQIAGQWQSRKLTKKNKKLLRLLFRI